MRITKNGNYIYEEEDRVILTYTGFKSSLSNPTWGSWHACPGTVTRVTNSGVISVKWDSGRANSYRQGHLKPFGDEGKTNPNMSFIIYKRNYEVKR